MNNILSGIDSREKGSIPISIATALAVESACGVYPDKPVSPAPVTNVKEVWFNVLTLTRNLLGSLSPDIRDLVTEEYLVTALLEELTIIESALVKESNGLTRTVFYHCDYSSLGRKFPNANLKVPTSPKQIAHNTLLMKTASLLAKSISSAELRSFKFELVGRFPNSLIVTHLPVDLLSKQYFQKLELLESHTGAIKAYPQWHTKLTNGKELTNIPFNSFTLQVFGDNGHQFTPILNSLRKEILQIAEENNWTTLTTSEKIRFSLRKIKDVTNRSLLMALL